MADTPDAAADTLIIACGNPLRGDDGVGPIVAERVEAALDEHQRKHCRVSITHQLLPELALELSQVNLAILIDARIADDEPPGAVRSEPVAPDDDAPADLTHHWTLPRLLAMSKLLYGQAPRAHIVSVSATAFEEPDTLSPPIQSAVPDMINQVQELIMINTV